MTELRYRELTYQLRGLIFETRKKLKTGWSEEIYHQGLIQLLQEQDIPVQFKPRKAIIHRGVEVHLFESDLIVWDLIVLELKVLPFGTFAPVHYAQLIHYLKCWGKDLGLLVNFGSTRAQIERVVWDEPVLEIYQNHDPITPYMGDKDRIYLRQVCQSLLDISRQYGLGYPETMYRKIAEIEIMHMGLNCQAGVQIPAKLDDRILAQYASDHLLIENSCLLNIRSLLDYPTQYDFARIKTYLNCLGLKFGLVANFGKKQLQIYGVSPE